MNFSNRLSFDHKLHLKLLRREIKILKSPVGFELMTCRSLADALTYCVGRHQNCEIKLLLFYFIIHFERKNEKYEGIPYLLKKEKNISTAHDKKKKKIKIEGFFPFVYFFFLIFFLKGILTFDFFTCEFKV